MSKLILRTMTSPIRRTRRWFLAMGGTVASIGIAGCTGDDDDGTPTPTPGETPDTTPTPTPTEDTPTPSQDPPAFELVEIDAPNEVEIDEEWNWSITIENVGESDGTFESVVNTSVGEDNWEELGEIELDVPAGESRTVESSTGSIPYITTVKFQIEEINTEFEVQTLTRVLESNESYRSPEDIVMTVEGIELRETYVYEGFDGELSVDEASQANRWAFVYLSVENDSGSSEWIPSASDFDIRVGDQQFEREFISKDEGQYEGGEVGPSVQRTGWVAFEIPADTNRDQITVEHFDSDFTGEWGVRWSSLESIQKFELVDVEYPNQIEVDREWTFELTVRNTADTSRSFETEVFSRIHDDAFEQLDVFQYEVQGSDERTIESPSISLEYAEETTILIAEIDSRFSFDVEYKQTTIGESYRNPDDIVTIVDEVDLRDSYTYEGWDGEEREEEAAEGMQWAFVFVEVENDGDESEYLPRKSDFTIRVGVSQFDDEWISKGEGEYDSGEVGPGVVREGWIAYEIPEELTADELTIVYSDSDFTGGYGAHWTE